MDLWDAYSAGAGASDDIDREDVSAIIANCSQETDRDP
jgi:hypothetical protein